MRSHSKPAAPGTDLAEALRKFLAHTLFCQNRNHYMQYAQSLTGSPDHPGMLMVLVSCPDEMVTEIHAEIRKLVDEAYKRRGLQSMKVQ